MATKGRVSAPNAQAQHPLQNPLIVFSGDLPHVEVADHPTDAKPYS